MNVNVGGGGEERNRPGMAKLTSVSSSSRRTNSGLVKSLCISFQRRYHNTNRGIKLIITANDWTIESETHEKHVYITTITPIANADQDKCGGLRIRS